MVSKKSTALALLLAVAPFSAHAQWAIDYTSGPIVSDSGPNAPPLGTDITGVITFPYALPSTGVTAIFPTDSMFSLSNDVGALYEPIGGAGIVLATHNGVVTNFLMNFSGTGYDANGPAPGAGWGEGYADTGSISGPSSSLYVTFQNSAGVTVKAQAGTWSAPFVEPLGRNGGGTDPITGDSVSECWDLLVPDSYSYTCGTTANGKLIIGDTAVPWFETVLSSGPTASAPEMTSSGAAGALTLLAGLVLIAGGRRLA